MNQIRLQTEDVIIERHKLALLTVADPAIAEKPLLRVPSGCGYTAEDWEACWSIGKIDFEDQYALSHNGKLPSKENLAKCGDYLYVNRLDPQDFHNWEQAWTRLRAADVIKVSEAPAPVQEQESQEAKYIDIEKMPSRTLEERRALRAATLSNLMLEAAPVVDQFFADLNAAGHYPTYEERRAMADYVENHNLFPHQLKSWETALRMFPKYLSEEGRALIALDRDDGPGTYVTADEIKKAVGKAPSARIAYAVPSM